MQNADRIKVETESGQVINVQVTSLQPDAIWILIGEGPHSSKCKLEPTRNLLAYVGSIMGREIIYQRSVKEVREDIARSSRGSTSCR
ncbi:hypothetical protein [Geopsychrobacter electrodiphilus]|uniref:hypothetical protein n=1 Tax=Geopsychrobacter electrodiphilus TaxID=225196 RepID=UPI00037B54A0|nr:hypothetical protein [Geopsychrobacter electrodiphilus]